MALNRFGPSDRYLFREAGAGVSIKLPAAKPTRTMLKNTLIIPSVWPNTNPPSNHKITAITTDITRVRIFESMMNLSV